VSSTQARPTPFFSPLSLAYLPGQQRFDPLAANSLFRKSKLFDCRFPVAHFAIHVAGGRKLLNMAMPQQGNLTIERQISKSWK